MNNIPKFLLSTIAFLLVFLPCSALADGGNWDDGGGCDGEFLGCLVVILGAIAILLGIVAIVSDIRAYGKETGNWPLPHPLAWYSDFSQWKAEQRTKS